MIIQDLSLNKVLTVDPGNITAYANWNGTNIPDVSSFQQKHGRTLEEKCEQMWVHFHRILQRYKPTNCYIEGVEVWSSSMKSIIASKRGDLFKLTLLIGGYCRVCQEEGTGFVILYPSKWKGQLNDEAICKRVLRATNLQFTNQHITDAVAMGLHLMRVL